MLVHFFWDKKTHWVTAQILKLPIEEGGQSLVVHPGNVFSPCLVHNLNYDRQLLFIDRDGLDVTLRTPPVFCQDLITVWNMVDLQPHTPDLWAHGTEWAGRSEDPLVGLLIGLAKLAISRSQQQAMEGFIMSDCLPLFCGYIHIRVSLEKEHVVCTGALNAFWE
eukprot:g37271.t1